MRHYLESPLIPIAFIKQPVHWPINANWFMPAGGITGYFI